MMKIKIKKLVVLVLVLLSCSLCFCACSTDDNTTINLIYGERVQWTQFTIDQERFEIIDTVETGGAVTVYDKDTKVMYYVICYYNHIDMTVLVDENGKPLLYKENDNNT